MEQKPTSPSAITGRHLVATLFPPCGILLIGRHLGIIPSSFFHAIVSWPMLLVALGAYYVLRKQLFNGLILLVIGFCFLIPRLGWFFWLPIDTSALLWPLVLVLVGVAVFYRPKHRGCHRPRGREEFTVNECKSTDGFLRSDNMFSGVKQVVLDELFRGASIRNSFGGTELDLRRTDIPLGETYIDIECNFGGVEIYVPLDWKIELQANAFLGSCEDKRIPGINIDQSRVLVIRGNVSFGSIEIKG